MHNDTKELAQKIVLTILAAAIPYIAQQIGGRNPIIDMQLLTYLVAGALALVVYWSATIHSRFKRTENENADFRKRLDLLMTSQQLLMRYRLVQDAREHIARGYIAQDDLDLWLQMYLSYETLGKNGVIDEYHYKIVRLPVVYQKHKLLHAEKEQS